MTRAVAYFGTYDPAYPRNAVLIEGLRHRGVTVHEFQAPLPSLPAAQMATPAGVARLAAGVAAAHVRLLAQHQRRLRIDAVVVGYPAAVTVPLAFLTMVVVSLLTAGSRPPEVARIFARMHVPERLGMGVERLPRE